MIEEIDFIEMMREFGRLVILRIENPYNLLWRIEEIRHSGDRGDRFYRDDA